MHTETKPRSAEKRIDKPALALKAARMLKGLTRQEAAKLCGCSPRAFEQLENGRCNYSEARIRQLTASMDVPWDEFQTIQRDPQKHIAQATEHKPREKTLERKPRRNEYKIITKEARVIRSLRKQKGLSQSEASRLCGYGPQGFSFLEAGRVELKPKKVEHILKCFGFNSTDFKRLMEAPLLRDEVIEDAVEILPRLTDQALTSILNVIKELAR